jgi:hypothetical protein
MKEITPERFRCAIGTCPAVFDDGENINIIGKRVTEADYPELAGRIGPDEAAVVIDAALLEEAMAGRLK